MTGPHFQLPDSRIEDEYGGMKGTRRWEPQFPDIPMAAHLPVRDAVPAAHAVDPAFARVPLPRQHCRSLLPACRHAKQLRFVQQVSQGSASLSVSGLTSLFLLLVVLLLLPGCLCVIDREQIRCFSWDSVGTITEFWVEICASYTYCSFTLVVEIELPSLIAVYFASVT
jgi:hypothetical protein